MTIITNTHVTHVPVVNRSPRQYANGYIHARTTGIALQSRSKVIAYSSGYLAARSQYFASRNQPVQLSLF